MSPFGGELCGSESLIFALPGFSIHFTGLDTKQKAILQDDYSRFIVDSQTQNAVTVFCRTLVLDDFAALPLEEYSREGQYTPLQDYMDEDCILVVRGLDFEAGFVLNTSPMNSWLGVARAGDLPRHGIVENYLRILSAHAVLPLHGLMLHSAGLVFNGRAYVFVGRSDAGKTTLTRKAHAAGAVVLSDDINLLLPEADDYRAYAVPFTGEFGRTLDHLDSHDSYPLAGIILLEQSDRLATERVSSSFAVARMLTGCPFVNTDEHESDVLFDSVARLASRVPVIRLLNRREDEIQDIMEKVEQGFTNIDFTDRNNK